MVARTGNRHVLTCLSVQVEQVGALISEFEDEWTNLVKETVNLIKASFRSLEDVAGAHADSLADFVGKLVQAYQVSSQLLTLLACAPLLCGLSALAADCHVPAL